MFGIKRTKYEYKDLNYDYGESIENGETLSGTINLTDDNIYSSFEKIDWNSLDDGQIVYYMNTDENGDEYVDFAINTPEMTKELFEHMKQTIIEQDELTVTKYVREFFAPKEINVPQAIYADYSSLTYDYLKSAVVDENGNDMSNGNDMFEPLNFNISDCENNFDFILKLLDSEGFSCDIGPDNPIEYRAYDYTYQLNNVSQDTIDKYFDEFNIPIFTHCYFKYRVVDQQLADILIEIYGKDNNDNILAIFVTYELSLK
jgi:hypothetical protein